VALPRRLLAILPPLYDRLNRAGLTERPWFRRVYCRAYFAFKRYAEDPFLHLTERHPALLRGGHVLDVGANLGYTAWVFARQLSGDFRVHAFEPEDESFRLLCETLAREQLEDRVEAVRSAVGERVGTALLKRNPSHPADHRVVTETLRSRLGAPDRVATVPMTSVDHFVEERLEGGPVSFVKVDVQGYEVAVCRGMRRLIRDARLTCFAFEYEPAGMRELGFEPGELLESFRSEGYAVRRIQRSGRLETPSDALLEGELTREGYLDLLMARPERLAQL
jgi:FkbM family methyltransferase